MQIDRFAPKFLEIGGVTHPYSPSLVKTLVWLHANHAQCSHQAAPLRDSRSFKTNDAQDDMKGPSGRKEEKQNLKKILN